MSATAPQRTNWSGWADNAPTRVCGACEREFKPNHPRRRFCGADDCPGRSSAPRSRRRVSARAQAAARAAGVQGFLGDVLVEANRTGGIPTPQAIGDQLVAMVRAERAGDLQAARLAAARMCALGANRAVRLISPPD